MEITADLHLHSHYSRAVSYTMNLKTMDAYAKQKGLGLLSTSDFIHPLWFKEITSQLEESHEGVFQLKGDDLKKTQFILTVEISSIYSQGGKVRRIHTLVFAPDLSVVEKIIKAFTNRGYNILSDGRPIIGLSAKHLLELLCEIDDRIFLIPCHIWTPWFSLYGSNSGFDYIQECFGEYGKYIYGIETGISSDPEMNWRIKDLENHAILSFSDAHSPAKMGREATVFELKELSYAAIREAIMLPSLKKSYADAPNKILYTIEFYPEEGKYHYNGHRKCKVVQTPTETKDKGNMCPVCKRKITIGVMQRVMELTTIQTSLLIREDTNGLQWICDATGKYPAYIKIVPLQEIIAQSLGTSVQSLRVKRLFDFLCHKLGAELTILLTLSLEQIKEVAGEKIAQGIAKVRAGNISISPGYDGEYGVVSIWDEQSGNKKNTHQLPLNLF